MNILEKIIENKKKEVETKKKEKTLEQLTGELKGDQPHFSIQDFLSKTNDFHFICEIKKASPSRGIIQSNFDPVRQAKDYLEGGAAAVSVLTDEKFFQGDLEFLKRIRKVIFLPLLRKDFIIDPYQIFESKIAGADILLLIARILSKDQIKSFKQLAWQLQLDILLEIGAKKDLEKIDDFNNVIIGINNRNLKTFEVDLNKSLIMKKMLPANVPVISESGIKSVDDCLLLAQNGFRGALVGETLMRANNPKQILQEWKTKLINVYPA